MTARAHPLAHLLGLAPVPKRPLPAAEILQRPARAAPHAPYAHLAHSRVPIILPESNTAILKPLPSAVAAAIVRAGERRRGEVPPAGPNLATPAGRMAAAILRAGEKRRGEAPPAGPDLSTPAGRVAAAILRAGRARRGERD